ncbi:MAG: hypothetical protein ABIN69_17820 [Aestuariivirga sp.]
MSKRLEAMRRNPQSDWKIADVESPVQRVCNFMRVPSGRIVSL